MQVLRATTALAFCAFASIPAQTPISREAAIASAASLGARIEIARADTTVAYAALIAARERPNPGLGLIYTKSTPRYSVAVTLPLDLPAFRNARIGSARSARLAAQLHFAFERAGVALDADTTYTRALAAREKARISRRNALETDSLRRIVIERRAAGKTTDVDVEIANIIAGQAANISAADSLTYLSTVLDLQVVMGLVGDGVAIEPTDSLMLPEIPAALIDSGALIRQASTLEIAAAEASVEAARLNTKAQRRSLFGSPGVVAGFEFGDPSGEDRGILPILGVAIPVPVLSSIRGPIAQAEAEQARARAALSLARIQNRNEIARVRRQLSVAYAKAERSRMLVAAASRVTSIALASYREGSTNLHTVLEAQRDARELLAQYIDNVADALVFGAKLRVITLAP